jgi:hypothetical protein
LKVYVDESWDGRTERLVVEVAAEGIVEVE